MERLNGGWFPSGGVEVELLPYNLVKFGLALVTIFLNLSNHGCLCV